MFRVSAIWTPLPGGGQPFTGGPVCRRDRRPDAQAVLAEVLLCDETAVSGEVVGDEASELASVERAGALLRDHPQCLGVVCHPEQLARPDRIATGGEDIRGRWRRLEDVHGQGVARRRVPQPLLLLLAGEGEPVLREVDRGGDQLGPGERAKAGGHLVEGHQRPRHGDGEIAHLVDIAFQLPLVGG